MAAAHARQTGRRLAGRLEQAGRSSMPQKITQSVKAMVAAAKREIEEIAAPEAIKLFGRPDVVLVDLRDPRERERDGKVPRTFHVARGTLECWSNPDSPYDKDTYGQDKKFGYLRGGGK